MEIDKHVGNRLRIGVLMEGDASGRGSSWPGTRRFMASALDKHLGDVEFIDVGSPSIEWAMKSWSKAVRLVSGQHYDYRHSLPMARAYAEKIKASISQSPPDLLLAAGMASEVALLHDGPPIVYTSDATFHVIKDYYSSYSRMPERSAEQADYIEQSVIDNAKLLIYPSEWVMQSAIGHYHAKGEKTFLIPYGANLDEADIPPRSVILQRPFSNRCRLLFLGSSWLRKGGDVAFETLLALEARGVSSSLTVCGCVPPESCAHKNLTVIPFIDKRDPSQMQQLTKLLLDSDYLLMPTRNECYGIVFCEASAFGLPSITRRTGGVGGVVRDGINGFMLPQDSSPTDFADVIESIHCDDLRRTELRRTSREAYEESLSWNAWGARVSELVRRVI